MRFTFSQQRKNNFKIYTDLLKLNKCISNFITTITIGLFKISINFHVSKERAGPD